MSNMDLVPSASQTIGPFFHFALTPNGDLGCMAGPDAKGDRLRLACRVWDGEGLPVGDAMIELWQEDDAFRGFGRLPTNEEGVCVFETVKPGRTPGPGATWQAPHVNVSVFARGLLQRLVTRLYFAGDPANPEDPVLALAPEGRRDTLLAHPDPGQPGVWNFEIHLSGERETVFFEV